MDKPEAQCGQGSTWPQVPINAPDYWPAQRRGLCSGHMMRPLGLVLPQVGRGQNFYVGADAGVAIAEDVKLKQFILPTSGAKLKLYADDATWDVERSRGDIKSGSALVHSLVVGFTWRF